MMKTIAGHPNYKATKKGVIVSFVYPRKPRILKQKVGTDGYLRVSIVPPEGGRAKWMLVHRLVLMAFQGPCPNGMEGCHLDGNRTNNHRDNLRWATHAENVRHKRLHGTDHNASKTHCAKGHPYDEKNTYYRTDRPGSRECRTCNRELQARKKVNAP